MRKTVDQCLLKRRGDVAEDPTTVPGQGQGGFSHVLPGTRAGHVTLLNQFVDNDRDGALISRRELGKLADGQRRVSRELMENIDLRRPEAMLFDSGAIRDAEDLHDRAEPVEYGPEIRVQLGVVRWTGLPAGCALASVQLRHMIRILRRWNATPFEDQRRVGGNRIAWYSICFCHSLA
jgi:hypothetical protein